MVTFSKFLENVAVGKTNSIVGSGPSAAKIGVIQLKDLDGSIIGTYNYVNGGYGRGYIPSGEYIVLPEKPVNPHQYDAMSRDGVAYKFPVALNNGSTKIPDKRVESIPTKDNPKGGPRDYIMIHPDGGTKGTMGCIGIQGNGQVQKDFYEKLNYLIKRNNGFYPLMFDTSKSSVSLGHKNERLPEQPSLEPFSEPTETSQQVSLSTRNNNVAKAFTVPGSNQPTEQPSQMQSAQSVDQPSLETDKPQQIAPQTTGSYKHKTTLDLINKLNEVK
jgi:hypothetical protein